MSFTINGKVFGKYQYIEYHLDADNSVDNAYLTDVYLTLSPDATDRDIIRALKQAGLLRAGLHYDKFAIGGELGGTLYPYHATHGPVCELRRVIDNCTRCHVERYYEHDLYADESLCTDCESEIHDEQYGADEREGTP
jgi:hypothetical protein